MTAHIATSAHPYAKAIFEIATTEKPQAKWSSMLKECATLATQKELQPLFSNPRISKTQLADLFIELGGKAIDEQGQHLIRLLAESRRLPLFPSIAALFEQFVAEQRNVVTARVTSANPLKEDQKKQLQQALKSRFGRDILLNYEIDKDLLAGVVVQAGDLVIDNSIRDRFKRLKENLLTVST